MEFSIVGFPVLLSDDDKTTSQQNKLDWGSFLETPGNVSNPKANFKIQTH